MTGSKRVCKTIAAIVAVVVAMAAFRMADEWNLKLLLLAPCVGYVLWRQGCRQWSAVDVAVGALWGYDVVQCFIAADTESAMAAMGPATTAMAVYWLARHGTDRRLLTGLLTVMAVALGAVFTGTFVVFRRAVADAGFGSCYDFRYLLTPLTMTPNMITSLLLALTGICLSSGRGRDTAAAGFVAAAMLLSFSRGAILALGLLGATLAATLDGRREKLRTAAVVASAFAAVWLCCPREMTTALSMASTESQRLSAMSRVSGTQAAAAAFAEKPVTGHGPYSYITATDPWNDSTGAITNLAPNWIAEIAVDKGAAGLALYAALGLTACAAVWRYRRNRATLVCGATLLALAFKEMTQSTVYGSTAGMTLVALLLALLQPPTTTEENKRDYVAAAIGMILIAGCAAAADIAGYRARQQTIITAKAAEECRKGDFEAAISTLDRLPANGAVNTAKAIVAINAFAAGNDTVRLSEAEKWLDSGVADSLTAELRALTALMRNKPDGVRGRWSHIPYEHAVWLGRSGRKSEALAALKRVVAEEPRLIDAVAGEPFAMDSAFMAQLHEGLRADLMRNRADLTPAIMARQGYLALRLGDTATAEARLRAATTAMPSYSTPWRLLAEISSSRGDTVAADLYTRRFQLLDNGIMNASAAFKTVSDTLTGSPQWGRIAVKYRIRHNTVLPPLLPQRQ